GELPPRSRSRSRATTADPTGAGRAREPNRRCHCHRRRAARRRGCGRWTRSRCRRVADHCPALRSDGEWVAVHLRVLVSHRRISKPRNHSAGDCGGCRSWSAGDAARACCTGTDGMTAQLVTLRNVSKRYGEGERAVWALRDVSLVMEPGEFVSLMGPSGSGKSSLLNLIAGLDLPTSGEVLVEGRRVSALSDRDLSLMRRHTI